MNDHSIAAMKKTHEELMEEQKRHFEEEIHLLKEEHDAELHEEKEATRYSSFYVNFKLISSFLRKHQKSKCFIFLNSSLDVIVITDMA